MKILGLDIGTKRIGLAISDALGLTAQGYSVMDRVDDTKIFKMLEDIISKEGVDTIVVGLPLNMDGSSGPKAKEAVSFCEKLKERIKAPVKLWDERMTTMEAERVMINADISRAKRRKKIDKLAAQLILQGYLDSQNKKEN